MSYNQTDGKLGSELRTEAVSVRGGKKQNFIFSTCTYISHQISYQIKVYCKGAGGTMNDEANLKKNSIILYTL